MTEEIIGPSRFVNEPVKVEDVGDDVVRMTWLGIDLGEFKRPADDAPRWRKVTREDRGR